MASDLLQRLVGTGMLSRQLADKVHAYAERVGIAASTSVLILTTIGENRLAQFLSRQLNHPCFEPRHMQDLPPVLREFLSMEQALKHRALPLRLEQKGLTMAIADPSDRGNLQTLENLIGYPPIPLVAPECRLLLAIERCYRMELPERERLLLRQMEPAADAPSVPAEEQIDEALLEEAEVVEDEGPDLAAPVTDVYTDLAAARCRDEVADALVAHLTGQFDRLALFMLRGGTLHGWRALNGRKLLPGCSDFRLPVANSAVLKSVLSDQSPFLGRIPEQLLTTQLSSFLKSTPERVVMLPLILAGRSIGMLYIEGDRQAIFNRVAELQNLLAKTAYALKILILRKKLSQQ